MTTRRPTSPVLTSTDFASVRPDPVPDEFASTIPEAAPTRAVRTASAVSIALTVGAATAWVADSLVLAQGLTAAVAVAGGAGCWLLVRQVYGERRAHARKVAAAEQAGQTALADLAEQHRLDMEAQQQRYERSLAAATDCVNQLYPFRSRHQTARQENYRAG